MAGSTCPPPPGVRDPQGTEQVVQVQPAAPVPADDLGRALGRVLISRRMTPAVVEVKRTGDVDQERAARLIMTARAPWFAK